MWQSIDAWREMSRMPKARRDTVGVARKKLPSLFEPLLDNSEYVYSRDEVSAADKKCEANGVVDDDV